MPAVALIPSSICFQFRSLNADGGQMSTTGGRVRSALAPRRERGDDKLYARAKPEKVEITESYSVVQEISKNPSMRPDGEGTGRIEAKVPYDGRTYFTR